MNEIPNEQEEQQTRDSVPAAEPSPAAEPTVELAAEAVTPPETVAPPPTGDGQPQLLVDCSIAKKRFSSVGLSCIVLLAGATVLQLLLMIPIYLVETLSENMWYLAAASYLPIFIAGYPLCMTVMRCVPRGKLEKQKMSAKGFFVCALMSIALLYVGNYIGLAVTALIRLVTGGAAANPLEALADSNILVRILFMVIAAPLCEEYIFRKQMIDRLHRYGEGVSILVSALLFGLIHGNLSQFFYAFLLGALFAYIYTRTGTIWYTVALHALINFLGGIVSSLVAEAMPADPTALMNAAPEEIVAMAAVGIYSLALMAAMIAGIVLLIKRRRRFVFLPTEAEIPKGLRAKTAFRNVGMILALVLLGLMTILQSLVLLQV